jgi:hypothetical protein
MDTMGTLQDGTTISMEDDRKVIVDINADIEDSDCKERAFVAFWFHGAIRIEDLYVYCFDRAASGVPAYLTTRAQGVGKRAL